MTGATARFGSAGFQRGSLAAVGSVIANSRRANARHSRLNKALIAWVESFQVVPTQSRSTRRVHAAATFALTILPTVLLAAAGSYEDVPDGVLGVTMVGYVLGFVALFVLSGVGNGSAYKTIPSIFEAHSRSLGLSEPDRRDRSPRRRRHQPGVETSYLSSGSATTAFWVLTAYYVAAAALTWASYLRRPAASTVQPTAVKERAAAVAAR